MTEDSSRRRFLQTTATLGAARSMLAAPGPALPDTSAKDPSYSASKAGISRYWEGLGLALSGKTVKLTNIRFGFVDTKMAKAKHKPLMLTAENAAGFIVAQVNRPRIRATKPYAMAVLVWLLERYMRLSLLIR